MSWTGLKAAYTILLLHLIPTTTTLKGSTLGTAKAPGVAQNPTAPQRRSPSVAGDPLQGCGRSPRLRPRDAGSDGLFSPLSSSSSSSSAAGAPPACKRKEQDQSKADRNHVPKRHRLVFTDIQRRTLHAIFHENQRPSKDLQITIAQQLGLELSTVSNFFMNARRRSLDKWMEESRSPSSGAHAAAAAAAASAVTCTKA
ncbi:Hepatocyte nuclear factor 6 [Varanus komodoensis]|nr:Hepatocyte nuclear factor 6 [Varanus komodoensis]